MAISADEALLIRAYRAMSREAWQDGETIEEVREAINDHMANKYGLEWDKKLVRKRKPTT